MKRRRYTREFKIEAVRLTETGDKTIADVAFDLGLHPNTLYRWRSELGVAGEEAFSGSGQMKAGDEEVRRLQREIARLRQERDILKKAVTFFAKENP
jgi:transposase